MVFVSTLDFNTMRDDFNTHSSAGLTQAEHGVVAILLLSILPR